MNHPAAIMGASSKIEQLRRSRQRGLDVPEWICTRSRAAAVSFLLSHGDVVAKPLASGYLERCEPSADTLIYTNRVLPTDVSADVPDLGAPTLFQKRCFGIDVRVTIVDEDVRAMELERTDGVIDVRRNNMRGVSYRTVHLPSELRTQLIRLVRSYQLRFAAIDMIRDSSDQWWFLELNPNGQWAWLDLEADANIFKAFIHAFAQWRA
jgi:glutathione synthase/RimK-type ligase-like ATP-grasp enzyme